MISKVQSCLLCRALPLVVSPFDFFVQKRMSAGY
jgi:hypothetical protein